MNIVRHQQLWMTLKQFENYQSWNVICWNQLRSLWMLQRNGIWWLAESFMAESFKHLICSRIHIFHSSMSNGSPWHAKPPPHRSQKLMKIAYRGQWEAAKPNKEHKHIFNQTSRSIVSCKLIGRIHAGLRGEFLPVLSDCSEWAYI